MPYTRSAASSPRTRRAAQSPSPTSPARASSTSSRSGGRSKSRSSHRKTSANDSAPSSSSRRAHSRDADDHDEDVDDADDSPASPRRSARSSKRRKKPSSSSPSRASKKRLLQVKVDDADHDASAIEPRKDTADAAHFDHPSTPARLPTQSAQPSPAFLGSSYLHPMSSPFPWSSALSPLPHTGGLPVPSSSSSSAPVTSSASMVPASSFRMPATPMSVASSSLELMSPSTHAAFSSDDAAVMPLSTPQLYKSPQKVFTFASSTPSTARPDTASSTSSSASSTSSSSSAGSQRPSYVQRLDFSTPEGDRRKEKDEGHLLRPSHLPMLSPGGFASPSASRLYGANDLLSPSPYHPIMSTLSPFIPPSRLDTTSASASSSSSVLSTPAGSARRPPSPALFSPAPTSHGHGGFPFSPLFPASPSASSLMFSPSSSFPSPSPLSAVTGGNAMVYQPFLGLPTPSHSAMLLNSPSSSLLSPSSFTSSPSSYSSHSSSASASSLNGSPLHPSMASSAASPSPLMSAAQQVTKLTSSIPIGVPGPHPYLSSLMAPPLPSLAVSSASSASSSASPSPLQAAVSSKSCNCKKSRCLKLYCECFARGEYCRDCNCVGCENTTKEEDRGKREKAIGQVMERDRNGFYRSTHAVDKNSAGGRALSNALMSAVMYRAAQQAQMNKATGNGAAAKLPPPPFPLPLLLASPFHAVTHPKGCHCKKSECQKSVAAPLSRPPPGPLLQHALTSLCCVWCARCVGSTVSAIRPG